MDIRWHGRAAQALHWELLPGVPFIAGTLAVIELMCIANPLAKLALSFALRNTLP
jgi:TctA family transporter